MGVRCWSKSWNHWKLDILCLKQFHFNGTYLKKKLMIEVLFLLILFHNGSQVVRSPTHAIVFENDHGSGVWQAGLSQTWACWRGLDCVESLAASQSQKRFNWQVSSGLSVKMTRWMDFHQALGRPSKPPRKEQGKLNITYQDLSSAKQWCISQTIQFGLHPSKHLW